MTTPPVPDFFNGASRTNQEAKDGFDDMLAVMAETVGGSALATYEIAAGAVTPAVPIFRVDVEDPGTASADDLDRVNVANHPDGRLIMLASVDAGRVVTLKHALSGGGEILTGDGADIALSDPSIWMMLVRSNLSWVEVGRFFGSQKAAARAYLGLGTVATRNVGAAAGAEIPDRDAADARYARLAVANVFSQDQTVTKGAGASRLAAVLTGGPTMVVKAEASTGRMGTESDHNVRIVRNDVSVLHLLSSGGVNVGEPSGSTGAFGLNAQGPVRENGRRAWPQSWAKVAPDGTLIAGENVLSITDIGTGKWRVNWNDPFADADHAVTVAVLTDAPGERQVVLSAQAAGSVDIKVTQDGGTDTEGNVQAVMVIAVGEYA